MGEAKRKAEAKAEAFKENPDMFVDFRELIIGVSLNTNHEGKKEPGILINPAVKRLLIVNALYDINEQVKQYIQHMDAESVKAKQSGLIVPGDNGKSRIGGM